MPKSMTELVRDLVPSSTVLLFGAGASLPSGAPSVEDMLDALSLKFSQPKGDFTLSELTELIERKTQDRRRLIESVQDLFKKVRPAGGIMNLPNFDWKSIYTTNYDKVVERAYERKNIPLRVVNSDFDFSATRNRNFTTLHKLHGSIDQDISLGSKSRLIITSTDYEYTTRYRESLYLTLQADLASSNLLIIGNSLSDRHIREIINKAIELNSAAMSAGRISILMYQENLDRALLYEGKGLAVTFGGIDEFFAAMAERSPGPLFDKASAETYVDRYPVLPPVTFDVAHEMRIMPSRIERMFNGWPASFSDIASGATFNRNVAEKIYQHFVKMDVQFVSLLGASGVGKTTAAKQALVKLSEAGMLCWSHNSNFTLQVEAWLSLARDLKADGKRAALLIDEAHGHLREINDLVDELMRDEIGSLFLILVSSKNNWNPRIKSPKLFSNGVQLHMSRLSNDEIERLIVLIESHSKLSRLIDSDFTGFSRPQKIRRLQNICESDMFVCMKNIFASDKFDEIVLREYNDLLPEIQDVYRTIAALENAGVRVHRQLIYRLLGIDMTATAAILAKLEDIVSEYTIHQKRHIYGWTGRHPVINSIICKYKFSDVGRLAKLYELYIDNLVPSYEIELRSITDLCSIETGIAKLPDRKMQNKLLRKMISVAPGERVPRHRLIRNLIDLREFEQAATEIRIFEKDFRRDAPVARYKLLLLIERASAAQGLMKEDRIAILNEASVLADAAIRRYNHSLGIFAANCQIAYELYCLTGSRENFEIALQQLVDAGQRIGDPAAAAVIRRYERLSGAIELTEPSDEALAEREIENIGELD